ncbi:MAG: class I SAM-dependent DNA methyltransferase [Burkholderiales bacterium]
MDAGCGSGLVGTLISDLTSRLVGVDMSAAMLEKAAEKGVYAQLCQDDLVSFMTNHSDRYDAVTCAATLIHFGDLAPAFEAAAACLRDGGIFVFTLFPNDGELSEQDIIVAANLGYATGGCYAHSSSYVRRIAESTGFSVEILDSVIHEYEFGKPVMGLIVALRRRFRTAQTVQ